MILDEIDAGVSGEMAKAMGSFMKTSEHTQLRHSCHKLQQWAILTSKYINLLTNILPEHCQTIIVEIAQMIDGNQITQTARTYAEKLLN